MAKEASEIYLKGWESAQNQLGPFHSITEAFKRSYYALQKGKKLYVNITRSKTPVLMLKPSNIDFANNSINRIKRTAKPSQNKKIIIHRNQQDKLHSLKSVDTLDLLVNELETEIVKSDISTEDQSKYKIESSGETSEDKIRKTSKKESRKYFNKMTDLDALSFQGKRSRKSLDTKRSGENCEQRRYIQEKLNEDAEKSLKALQYNLYQRDYTREKSQKLRIGSSKTEKQSLADVKVRFSSEHKKSMKKFHGYQKSARKSYLSENRVGITRLKKDSYRESPMPSFGEDQTSQLHSNSKNLDQKSHNSVNSSKVSLPRIAQGSLLPKTSDKFSNYSEIESDSDISEEIQNESINNISGSSVKSIEKVKSPRSSLKISEAIQKPDLQIATTHSEIFNPKTKIPPVHASTQTLVINHNTLETQTPNSKNSHLENFAARIIQRHWRKYKSINDPEYWTELQTIKDAQKHAEKILYQVDKLKYEFKNKRMPSCGTPVPRKTKLIIGKVEKRSVSNPRSRILEFGLCKKTNEL